MKTLTATLLAVGLMSGVGVSPVLAQDDPPQRREGRDQNRDRDNRDDQDRQRPDRPDQERQRPDRQGRPDRDETPVDIEKVKEFLKEMDPRQAEMFQELQRKLGSKDLGPDQREELTRRMNEILRGVSHQMREMEEMKKRNPEEYERMMKMHKLERESMELAEKMRKAESGTDKGAIKDKLKTVLGELFDLREANRTHEVEMLEKRLKELKETMEKRKQNRDQIIERRLGELMGKEDSMNW